MPRAITVYLKSTDVPKRKALQEAVDDLKLGLTLDEAYMPFEMAGYLPCILNGEDAGFDMWFKNRTSEFTVSPRFTIPNRRPWRRNFMQMGRRLPRSSVGADRLRGTCQIF